MNSRKKYQQLAKLMYKNSLDKNGTVKNSAVLNILETVVAKKPQSLTAILKIYKRLIEKALSWEEAVLESPVAITKQTLTQVLSATGAKRIKIKINPSLVFGAKITHGDWIYNSTLDQILSNLRNLS